MRTWCGKVSRCAIKRSLREGYKQVFEELIIVHSTVYSVVRDEIKSMRFSEDVNVIGFTAFISEELPNHRARWANLLRA